MKALTIFVVTMLISTSLFSQELTKKEARQQADSIAFSNLVQLIGTKDYQFHATQVLPQSGPSKILTTDYSLTIRNDSVICDLPFFGRAYRVDPMERGGFFFSAPVSEYEIETDNQKKRIDIKIATKNRDDNIQFFLSITSATNATLSVSSNNRSNISYWGDIKSPDQNDED